MNYWTCPRCFGGNSDYRIQCSWCQYNPKKDHLTEEDVQRLVHPIGEILYVWYVKDNKGWVKFPTPLRDPEDYPPHENWRRSDEAPSR